MTLVKFGLVPNWRTRTPVIPAASTPAALSRAWSTAAVSVTLATTAVAIGPPALIVYVLPEVVPANVIACTSSVTLADVAAVVSSRPVARRFGVIAGTFVAPPLGVSGSIPTDSDPSRTRAAPVATVVPPALPVIAAIALAGVAVPLIPAPSPVITLV